jgi:hypothetical protein
MAGIAAVTIEGTQTDLPGPAVEEFGSTLRGELIRAGDPGYEPALEIWNARR